MRDRVTLPPGYRLVWAGQYEHLVRAEERLKLVVPVTLVLILLLLYLNFRSLAKSLIVLLSVPFAAIGAIWYLAYLDFNLSVAVWVGIIALAGVAAETGVVMLVYLDEAYERRVREGRMATVLDLREAIMEGAVQAGATQDDDRRGDCGRVAPDHVDHRHGRRRDETHRRADDRGHGELNNSNATGNSDALCFVASGSARRESTVSAHLAIIGADFVSPMDRQQAKVTNLLLRSKRYRLSFAESYRC